MYVHVAFNVHASDRNRKKKKMEEKVTLVFIRNMESRVGFSRNEDTFDRYFGTPCILYFDFRLGLSSKRKGNTFKLFCDDSVTIYIYT